MKTISVVIPCFNEQDNARQCYDELRSVFAKSLPAYDYEFVFVDNCSEDRTADILRELAAADPKVKVVLNSRNFGAFASIFNGLRYATGDAIQVMVPADLQDPPDVIPELVAKWEEGYEVVYGVRKNRQETLFLRSMRKIFYRLVALMANIRIPLDAGEFQLIDRRVLQAVLEHEDYYPYIRGIIANSGFRAIGVPYTYVGRKRGVSSQNWYRMVDQALNGIISFTNVPMRLAIFAGLAISTLSLVYVAAILLVVAFGGAPVIEPGITTIIVAVFFFGGVQLFALGIVGEYIAAIHSQVRKRPLVVVRETINVPNESQ